MEIVKTGRRVKTHLLCRRGYTPDSQNAGAISLHCIAVYQTPPIYWSKASRDPSLEVLVPSQPPGHRVALMKCAYFVRPHIGGTYSVFTRLCSSLKDNGVELRWLAAGAAGKRSPCRPKGRAFMTRCAKAMPSIRWVCWTNKPVPGE